MKFYLKYILSRIVIGLVILGLLSLAGCEERAPAQVERIDGWQLEVNVSDDEAIAIISVDKRIRQIEADLADIKEARALVELYDPNTRARMDQLATVAKSNQVLVRTLTDIEAVQSKKEYLCDDIDPNAPINTHLLKVSDSWSKEYGTSHESVLKYNVVAAWAFAQKALKQIVELEKRVKALEPVEGTVKIEANGAWYAYSGTDWVKIVDPIIPISIKALEPEWVDPNEVKE